MNAQDLYKELYPDSFNEKSPRPITGYTLNEIRIRPIFSDIVPQQVNLESKIGPVTLNLPLISAAMDTVSGPDMACALSEVGGCAIIDRAKRPEVQLGWIKQALESKPCLVKNPKTLNPDQPLEYAWDILREHDISTVPIVSADNILLGILFSHNIAFKDHANELIEKWMVPFEELKTESPETPFEKIKDRLLNEQECSVLPVIDAQRKLQGIYFMQDFFDVNPSTHNGKPLIGMAIGVHETDLERVEKALEMGIGMIVIDSSHGNCQAVIEQTKRIVPLAKGKAAIIAGNVADVDGYIRLAEAGADGVKCGIGSGSICTTSSVTGAGVPMFSLIRELSFARKKMKEAGENAPAIISDGGINGPGEMVIALAAGSNLCMAGKWLVSAKESLSCQKNGAQNGYVFYRGMASKTAIDARISYRYGKQKRAAEGVEGMVEYRGPLKTWIGKDMELVQGGFAHAGAKNIEEFHNFGNQPMSFIRFTSFGQNQISTRVEKM